MIMEEEFTESKETLNIADDGLPAEFEYKPSKELLQDYGGMDGTDQQQQNLLQQSAASQQLQQKLVDPNSCIILHPGSRNLRLGLPSHSVPFTVLHAIARRQKDASASKRLDPSIVPLAKMSSDRLREVEDCRLKVSHILQSSLTSDGTRRFATPPKQLSTHNRRVNPELDDELSEPCPALLQPTQDYVTGDEVLNISPHAPYHIHYPWQRGDLNSHGGIGGSLTAVMSDLELIWSSAIQDKLNIAHSDFKMYGCCVVIPDLYNREHVVHITELLLNSMGFAACFVFQDHVAATFGSGLGCACVVDVGDQKTSVSCVEDALSIASSRLRLSYGGSDVSQVLHWLLRKGGFPLSLEPSTNSTHATLVNHVKHTYCHVNLDKCGPEEQQVRVLQPGSHPVHYTVQLGDELLIAPLSLFYPALLQLTGDKTTVLTQPDNPGHHQDPFDENYLRDNSRRGGKETAETAGGGEVGEEDMVVEDQLTNNGSSGNNNSNNTGSFKSLMSLEQAIHKSIEGCGEEARRRMYSNILLVGSGANFAHLGRWLHSRLLLQIPMQFRPEQVEVMTRPKDLDPGMTAWKGAALMTGLEGSGELWISQSMWEKMGVRVLREKCPFIW
uniref:Actin-related protein 8 isoform X1 n=2 Tax=Hirondellea gigas TaxID=1518452 RepID=A0A6A7G4U5_9CRUS